ncbi:MAG TPA: sodium:solute symporter, partial [Flavobacteriales bacterium]|nr:sodium:solute symporter [Flavobacteriales bacterium]
MSPILILSFITLYFLVLLGISFITSKNSTSESFFLGNRKSPWYVVAFGMIGTSLSGVTFISVPGWVGSSQFSYMQTVLGYLIGYFIIAYVLLPVYYRLNLTSIYSYLEKRFGYWSYKTGAFFFLLSRILGASFRLFLVATVLQEFVFGNWGIPFEVTVLITIMFIWLYTYKGGIKTIIWTDTLQTFFMLTAVGLSIYFIAKDINLSIGALVSRIAESEYSTMFFLEDFKAKSHLVKQLL